MGGENAKIITQKPHISKDNDICFGGEKEQDMINNFISFDILWYAPDSSEKLEKWKAFANVNVYKTSDENEFINIVEKQTISYFVIITTGSFAEKTIPKLKKNIIPPNVIIYCMNSEHHKKWSGNYNFIVGVFTQPSQIFEYLLELQYHDYDIPLFSYRINYEKEFNFNYYDYLANKDIIVNENIFSLKLNKYEKFCINMLHDFRLANKNIGDYFIYFSEDASNVINLFYGPDANINNFPGLALFFSNNEKINRPAKELLNVLIGLTLISIYFSKLPYLFGILSYEETEAILKEDLTLEELVKDYNELRDTHLNILIDKLNKEKVSILEETIHLKFLHIFLIKFLKRIIKLLYEFSFDEYSKYPKLINNFMDLDFCLKLFLFRLYGGFKCSGYKTKCRGALDEIDKRILVSNCIYFSCHGDEKWALKSISTQELHLLNENLKIKDFIVIGKNSFHKIIKNIENNFTDEKTNIAYLQINELRSYLEEKRKKDDYRKFTYFVIMEAKIAENIYKELYKIKDEFGLNLYLILYTKYEKTLINKEPFLNGYFMPIYIAYNINDISNFIKSQNNLCGAFNLFEQSTTLINKLKKIKFPKVWDINKDDSNVDKLNSENGWQLVESVPEEVFKITIFGKIGQDIPIDKMKVNIFKIYKENNILSLFFENYCKYFSYSLMPEIISNNISSLIRQFCYAYSLEEPIKNQSFYFILNKDLRSGDPTKIEKYLEIISIINKGIELNRIKSFKGQLFRGTYVDKDFLDNKIIKDKLLTNLSFWSASKSRKTAEIFMTNILFIIDTKGKNIDIHEEKISRFDNEEEVLFLPFSKFLIKDKTKKKYGSKEIFEVQLEGKDELHERDNISSVSITREEIYAFYDLCDK